MLPMKRLTRASGLIAVITVSAAWAWWTLHGQRPARPVPGVFQRSKVDDTGHTRGVVQVDLMRQIMDERIRSVSTFNESEDETGHRIPTQAHPLLGRPAPPLVLEDAWGKPHDLGAVAANGPVVLVFYLGSTCMACVTHLVELEQAMPRIRARARWSGPSVPTARTFRAIVCGGSAVSRSRS